MCCVIQWNVNLSNEITQYPKLSNDYNTRLVTHDAREDDALGGNDLPAPCCVASWKVSRRKTTCSGSILRQRRQDRLWTDCIRPFRRFVVHDFREGSMISRRDKNCLLHSKKIHIWIMRARERRLFLYMTLCSNVSAPTELIVLETYCFPIKEKLPRYTRARPDWSDLPMRALPHLFSELRLINLVLSTQWRH